MNPDKLKQLQNSVRIGGKGTPRRKKKVVHRTATTDDKKLQSSLKKLAVNNIPGIEEVNMIKEDGQVIHFNNPKVQASLAANTFAITGHAETKPVGELMPLILNQLGPEFLMNLRGKTLESLYGPGEITEMLPGILNQLGAESLSNLKKLATNVANGGANWDNKPATEDIDEDDDDVPQLEYNFDEPSKGEGV